MKKILFFFSIFLLLGLNVSLAQLTPSASPNVTHSSSYTDMQTLVKQANLPPIAGKWYFVDPYDGDNANPGDDVKLPVATLDSAYGLCTSGSGDGIVVYSRHTDTSSYTTTYLHKTLAWSKNDITVVGVSAPVGYFGRARITNVTHTTGAVTSISQTADHTISRANGSFLTDGFEAGDVIYLNTTSNTNDGSYTIATVTATTITTTSTSGHVSTQDTTSAGSTTIISYCAPLITITGTNNSFYNLHIANGGTIVQAIGGVSVQANRNYFKNCHIIGASNATAAAVATTQYDIEVGASETVFDDCYFGTNSTLWAAANAHIKLGRSTTAIGQNFFNRCHVISNSATAGHGAIIVTDAATLGGWNQFSDCTFVNWQSGAVTALTTAIIGATPNNVGILLNNCGMVGWAAWGADDNTWYATNAAGAATGGKAATQ